VSEIALLRNHCHHSQSFLQARRCYAQDFERLGEITPLRTGVILFGRIKVDVHQQKGCDPMAHKPKHSLTKGQLAKRKKRRHQNKPAKMQVRIWLKSLTWQQLDLPLPPAASDLL